MSLNPSVLLENQKIFFKAISITILKDTPFGIWMQTGQWRSVRRREENLLDCASFAATRKYQALCHVLELSLKHIMLFILRRKERKVLFRVCLSLHKTVGKIHET